MKMYYFSINVQPTTNQVERLRGENPNYSFNRPRCCVTYPFCLLDHSALIG